MMLTQAKRLEKLRRERELHRMANEDIKIYNSFNAMRGNPFSGDTTVLPFGRPDNRRNSQQLTENDILDSVLNPESHRHSKRNLEKLVPELVSNDVRDYWQQKINNSILRNAKALRKCE